MSIDIELDGEGAELEHLYDLLQKGNAAIATLDALNYSTLPAAAITALNALRTNQRKIIQVLMYLIKQEIASQ
ncbi:MAG TPA: hypothetical protein VIH42_05625 [Thermoguttaceae bacterium]